MPCPNTTQVQARKHERPSSPSFSSSLSSSLREVATNVEMAEASTPARSRRASQASPAASRPSSRASAHLDATVRYPPPDAFRLFSSEEVRDPFSLASAARQAADAHGLLPAPTSQASSSSFSVLRAPQAGSSADQAIRAPARSCRPSPSPVPTCSSRLSSRAGHAEDVLLQMFVRLSEQLTSQAAAQTAQAAAQSAQAAAQTAQSQAQMAALSTVMQRFEELHPASPPSCSRRPERFPAPMLCPPSRRASPACQSSPHCQSAPDIRAPLGTHSRFAVRPLASLRRSPAQVPLAALQQAYQSPAPSRGESPVQLSVTQQAHLLPPAPLANVSRTQLGSLDQLGPPMSNVPSPNGDGEPAFGSLARTARASLAIASICSSSCTALAVRATRCEHCDGAGWSAARHHIRATRASVVSEAVLDYARTASASPARVCSYADSYSSRSACCPGRSLCFPVRSAVRMRSTFRSSRSTFRCMRSARSASGVRRRLGRERCKRATQAREQSALQ